MVFCPRLRPLILLDFLRWLSDFSYLPEITLPNRRRLENWLLPLEANGWFRRDHHVEFWVGDSSPINYRWNSSVLIVPPVSF